MARPAERAHETAWRRTLSEALRSPCLHRGAQAVLAVPSKRVRLTPEGMATCKRHTVISNTGIVITVTSREPALFCVARIGGGSIDLRWPSGLLVPPGVQVNVADFGHRADIAVTRGIDQVGVAVDLETGSYRVETDLPIDAVLVRFAVVVLDVLLNSRRLRGRGPLRRNVDRPVVVPARRHWSPSRGEGQRVRLGASADRLRGRRPPSIR
jgi:hypothetical protein